MKVACLKILRQSKILDPMWHFREVANCKINMQKLVGFLYSSKIQVAINQKALLIRKL